MICTTLTLTLGFAYVYISRSDKDLYAYHVLHLIMFCYMLPHIVIYCEIDCLVVMDYLGILTAETCGKIISARAKFSGSPRRGPRLRIWLLRPRFGGVIGLVSK